MQVLLLIAATIAVALSANSIPTRPGRAGPWWFPALLTGELAPFHAAGQVLVGTGFWAAGWAGGWAGRIALAMIAVSIGLLGMNHARGFGSRRAMEAALAEAMGNPARLPGLGWPRLLRPYPSLPRSVEVVRDLVYGADPAHRFDRFSPSEPPVGAPVLLQVHGGGWTGGRRDQQARPTMHRMASVGWVVYSISYRLSPKATFPDQLIDVKRAIAWIREHGHEHGADPSFLAVIGGSAGGQLAALAGLTANQARYQPGFEEADTAVQACIPRYGVHDLLDRTGTRPKWPYLSRYVLKAEPADDPGLWESASSVRAARPDRPPFLVVHGTADTLVRPGESRRLAAARRAAGPAPVGLAEVPGATHGFDALHSLRAERTVDGIQAFLEWALESHRREASLGRD